MPFVLGVGDSNLMQRVMVANSVRAVFNCLGSAWNWCSGFLAQGELQGHLLDGYTGTHCRLLSAWGRVWVQGDGSGCTSQGSLTPSRCVTEDEDRHHLVGRLLTLLLS